MKAKTVAVIAILTVLLSSTFLLPMVKANPHTDITVAQAYDIIYSNNYPNLIVIDVRGATSPPEPFPENFNNGHILGAINAPVISLGGGVYNFAGLDAWISSPEGQSHKNDEIIVYCRTGGRSNVASNRLDANGFTKVYDMLGGFQTWSGTAGYPVVTVNAVVDIQPDTLNLESNGKFITCYIELTSPNSVGDIALNTIKIEGTVPAELKPTAIDDYDNHGVSDLMVKFSRAAVEDLLADGAMRLWVTFQLTNNAKCGGWDRITVIG